MPRSQSDTVPSASLPLCVDLDGTLILTDSLWESCLRLISQRPWMLLLLPLWLLSGKAGFKHKVAQHVQLDATSLPYNTRLLQYLTKQKLQHRHLVLVTAANRNIAERIAEHLNIFDEVLASDQYHNLSGSNKASVLCEKFGEKGFVYAGNAHVDLKVWQYAAAAVVVNGTPRLQQQAQQYTPLEYALPVEQPLTLKIWLKAIRVHQWVKNLLLFVPLLLAHAWDMDNAFVITGTAFLAFSLAASAIYLFNDLMDLDSDRAHATKRLRPLAAGVLPVQYGIMLMPLLLAAALLLAWQIHTEFMLILLLYLVLTTAYSLFLKPIELIDVITLTSLYTLRIIAGGIALQVDISYWLVAFSLFIFLSLALIKRFSELKNLISQQGEKVQARGYHIDDLYAVGLFGISSAYVAVMILVLYIHDLQADTLYANPDWLWLVSISILYWISHLWLLAWRGKMNEDPILFAIRNKASYYVALITAIGLFLAI